MKAEFSEINWFENAGKPIEEGKFTIPIKIVNSKDKCLEHNNLLVW